MSTLKRAKVVMLTTKNHSMLYDTPWDDFPRLYLSTTLKKTDVGNTIAKHLYILSDEEIKEGDWFALEGQNEKDVWEIFRNNGEEGLIDGNCKKIIATTDKSLKIITGIVGSGTGVPLPQPSEGFLDVYVDFYNRGKPITEVMVEYEEWNHAPHIKDLDKPSWLELKINPKDNTITIHKCKDSWSREEVVKLLSKHCSDIMDCTDPLNDSKMPINWNNKWIEENL